MEQLALSGVGAPLQAVTDFVFVPDCIFRADVILIAGGSRPELAWRATELFKAGAGRFVLPSGGPNKRIPEYPSEWAFLREILIERGVPEHTILREDRATHTFDNAHFSWAALQSHLPGATSAILVTKAHHSRRALLTYQSVFPPEFVFGVATIRDERDIGPENWTETAEGRSLVMAEVEKIGRYFGAHIEELRR